MLFGGSQGTVMSQLSPLDLGTPSSGRSSFLGGLQIPSSVASHRLDDPFSRDGATPPKDQNIMLPFGDEDDMPFGGDLLRIDEDGNIIDEPLLPVYPERVQNIGTGAAAAQATGPSSGEAPGLGSGDLHMGDLPMEFGEAPLPDAEALPSRQQPQVDVEEAADHASATAAAEPARRRKARVPKALGADDETRIPRDEFRSWSDNYLANVERTRKTRHPVTEVKARKNAYHLTFGVGIANIGQPPGIHGTHPLAEMFAGPALLGRLAGVVEPKDKPGRGRRRSSSEAFGTEEDEEERRVRPRSDDYPQVGRSQQEAADLSLVFGDEVPPVELGRDPGSILSDQPVVPWNRPSSVLHSSIAGSAQKAAAAAAAAAAATGRQPQSSPLAGRRSILPDIERFSDNALQAFGSDGLAPLRSHADVSMSSGPASGSPALRAALDQEGRRFMDFVDNVARDRGTVRAEDNDDERHWIEFHDLFEPGDSKRVVAAQAFYHVLSLATKGMLAVEQEGQSETPFGTIRIGIQLTLEQHGDFDEYDEDHGEEGQEEMGSEGADPDDARDEDGRLGSGDDGMEDDDDAEMD